MSPFIYERYYSIAYYSFNIPKGILKVRKERGLTQNEFDELIGVMGSTVWFWENEVCK
ncbi:MAG: DNA-binding transcriptional regulator YiaG [Maribacter sp.]|jgi:DNA-binding transcriptional regulator YiaG